MGFNSRGILSPLRLPISPPGRRLGSESNRHPRLCRPLHNHSATQPINEIHHPVDLITGAGNETRTRDPNLGKVVLYQLSYSRLTYKILLQYYCRFKDDVKSGQAAFRYIIIDHNVKIAAIYSKIIPEILINIIWCG